MPMKSETSRCYKCYSLKSQPPSPSRTEIYPKRWCQAKHNFSTGSRATQNIPVGSAGLYAMRRHDMHGDSICYAMQETHDKNKTRYAEC